MTRIISLAEAGYSHVGLRLLPATATEPQYDLVGDTPLLREVVARLADTGVRVLDVEIFRLRPETLVEDFEAAIATAARLIERFGAFCDLAARYGLGAGQAAGASRRHRRRPAAAAQRAAA